MSNVVRRPPVGFHSPRCLPAWLERLQTVLRRLIHARKFQRASLQFPQRSSKISTPPPATNLIADIETDLRALVLELTVPETYFFRHIDQFRAFATHPAVWTVSGFVAEVRAGGFDNLRGPLSICWGQGVTAYDRDFVCDGLRLRGLGPGCGGVERSGAGVGIGQDR